MKKLAYLCLLVPLLFAFSGCDEYTQEERTNYEPGGITMDDMHRGLYLLDFLDFVTQEQYDIAMDFIDTEFPGLRHGDFGTHDVIMSYIVHLLESFFGWEGASDFVMAYDTLPFDENVSDPTRILVKMMEVVFLDFLETSYLYRGYMPGGEQSRSNTLFRRPLVLND